MTEIERGRGDPSLEDMEIANAAVLKYLDEGGNPVYQSAQGYACALEAIRLYRVSQASRVAELEGALKQCSLRFMEYADSHFSKGTPDGDMKGQRNVDMVEMIEKAIGRDGDG